jgi:Protein kinase domain
MPGDPRRFGRYEVVRHLGGGAMGEVWLARDDALGREVAVKAVRPTPGVAEALFRARFDAEARALAALRHPAIVAVFDVGWEDDVPYLVMELVPGGSLKDRLAGGPLAPAEVRALGIQIGGALAAAHAGGILHRDVKPANVLGGPGDWKLADFGIAHVPGSELTLTGQFLGTPAYAAPEALVEGEHAPAADVWGLGATLYAAVTGAPPYGGPLGAAAATTCPAVAERAPRVPAALARAIDGALARDPARRPTATALCEQLAAGDEATVTGAPAVEAAVAAGAPAWRWPAIAGGAIVVLGLIAALAGRGGGGHGVRGPGAALPAGAEGDDEPGAADQGAGAAPVRINDDGTLSIDRARLDATPRSADARHHLDKALEKAERGDLDPAIHELDHVLDRDPSDQQVRALRDALDAARERDDRGPPGPPGHRKHHKHDD